MNLQPIILISHGHFESDFLEILAARVLLEYRHPVELAESRLDLSKYYDPARKQYDGNGLLAEIESTRDPEALKVVGLFRVDLFIPILTYIYGQAFLNGKTAIASLFRLNNERYGMPMDERLLIDRFSKEVIHELGHTFGLKHCHIPGCVMNSSTYVEDIDQKGPGLCSRCRQEADQVLPA